MSLINFTVYRASNNSINYDTDTAFVDIVIHFLVADYIKCSLFTVYSLLLWHGDRQTFYMLFVGLV